MNRLFKLPLVIALTLGSTQLLAVDFGQVRVMSNLGQPLRAEIPVRGATPAELQNLTAKLASGDEYERAGITGGRIKVPLNFSVVAGRGGQHFIRITSATPVDDPYLDLLLDVNTAAGKSVHEFAILLDPPGTPEPAIATGSARTRSPASTGATPRTASPASTAAKQSASAKGAPAAGLAGAVAANKPAGAVIKGMYGPVERGQTLSGIAQQTMPPGVDINQMLLAIKRANPDAFYRDNINTLKAGAVLRLPSVADAQTMAAAAAIAEVRRQNSDWRAGTASTPATVADSATRPSASSAPTTTAASKSGDRLALLAAATDTGKTAPGTAGSHAGESAAELRKSLLQAQETLASEQQQVADLKSHLKELTDVNSKSERLLSLKNGEIADLQAKLAAARKTGLVAPAASVPGKAGTEQASAVANAPAAARTSTSNAAMVPATGSTAAQKAVTPGASTALAPPAPAVSAGAVASAKPVANKSASSPTPARKPVVVGQPWYMQTWAWIAGAGIVVLLILLALLGRQRKRPAPVSAKSPPSLADSFGGAAAAGGVSADDVDQGELLDQLAEHPDDLGLHLKLVTLYYSRRDVEHFEAAAEAMYAHISDPEQDEWQDVVRMGEDLVPGHPLFTHQIQSSTSTLSAPLQDFNIDDYADDTAPTLSDPVVLASAPVAYPNVNDARFDFNAGTPSGVAAGSDRADVAPTAPPPALSVVPAAVVSDQPAAAVARPSAEGADDELGEFNDDPIDTKLDLARAYLDMGDEEGARAMLDEVLKEGSQMQKDVAATLLAGLQH